MAIEFKKVSHVYSPSMPYAYTALKDIDASIEEGKITAIIGETGSGKSTLVQHLNALLLPTSGELDLFGYQIKAGEKNKNLKNLREKVGLVFQFSEYQLFEESILKDVAFGPQNFGVSAEEAFKRAKTSLRLVGLDESYDERSPLDLSGGQKRRAAIAGILAMNPETIVLDEPTAGLDPHGAREMIKLFSRLNRDLGKTIILVCHDNEIVYRYTDNTIVMNKGEIVYQGETKSLFKNKSLREQLGLMPPRFISLHDALVDRGFSLNDDYDDLEGLITAVAKEIRHE